MSAKKIHWVEPEAATWTACGRRASTVGAHSTSRAVVTCRKCLGLNRA